MATFYFGKEKINKNKTKNKTINGNKNKKNKEVICDGNIVFVKK